MRLVSLGLVAFSVSIAACGGGDDMIEIVVDAAPPDAEIIPDSEPFVCPDDECDGVCVNFDNDETACGDCTTQCTGGEVCGGGTCACPPGFVPAAPSFLGSQLTDLLPGAVTGFGLYANPGGGFFADALGVAYPLMDDGVTPDVTLDMDYTLTGALEAPGILAGYNVDIQNMTADSAYAVTAGTVRFTAICDGGFRGTAADLTFSGINSFTDPTIPPDACTFTVATLAFAFGTVCP